MPLPELTPELESAIRTGHALGKSQADIARSLTMKQTDISRLAKRMGILWNVSPNVAAMTDKVRERIASQRAHLAEAALADAIALRERIWDTYEMVVSTPAGPERLTLDLPDAKAVSEFSKAVENLIKTHENMTRLGAMTSAAAAASVLAEMQTALEKIAAEDEGGDE
jgi:hypothetical protein